MWACVHVCTATILYIWFRKLTQRLPSPTWHHHHSATWPYPKIPWETNSASLKTGLNWPAIERRRRFNPWRDRVANEREWREGADTSHTGKEEGGGRRRKWCRLRTFQKKKKKKHTSTRQQGSGRITDMTNFRGSQELTMADRHHLDLFMTFHTCLTIYFSIVGHRKYL